MRKYRGKYPNNICEVSGTKVRGRMLVKTNNGGYYFIDAKDTDGLMPKLGVGVHSYKFTRAQPMTFQQDVTRFHRMLDGYALPFVEYPAWASGIPTIKGYRVEELEETVRNSFITDMVRQGILPRFNTGEI